jgi:hypothetical protein
MCSLYRMGVVSRLMTPSSFPLTKPSNNLTLHSRIGIVICERVTCNSTPKQSIKFKILEWKYCMVPLFGGSVMPRTAEISSLDIFCNISTNGCDMLMGTNLKLMIIIFWEMTPWGAGRRSGSGPFTRRPPAWVLIRATRCHFPEDDNHHSRRRGNLESYIESKINYFNCIWH